MYQIPAEPLRGTGWGYAPHTCGHSFMKRVTRKGRHVRFGQIPLNCPFSWRRAQSPAVIVTGQFSPSWLSHGAPFMPPRKRAQGFDVALYRRGAGRLSAAEEDFAASPTPSWHASPPKKTRMLPSVLAVQRLEKPTVQAPLCKGSCPVGAEGLYLARDVTYNPSVCPSGSQPTARNLSRRTAH